MNDRPTPPLSPLGYEQQQQQQYGMWPQQQQYQAQPQQQQPGYGADPSSESGMGNPFPMNAGMYMNGHHQQQNPQPSYAMAPAADDGYDGENSLYANTAMENSYAGVTQQQEQQQPYETHHQNTDTGSGMHSHGGSAYYDTSASQYGSGAPSHNFGEHHEIAPGGDNHNNTELNPHSYQPPQQSLPSEAFSHQQQPQQNHSPEDYSHHQQSNQQRPTEDFSYHQQQNNQQSQYNSPHEAYQQSHHQSNPESYSYQHQQNPSEHEHQQQQNPQNSSPPDAYPYHHQSASQTLPQTHHTPPEENNENTANTVSLTSTPLSAEVDTSSKLPPSAAALPNKNDDDDDDDDVIELLSDGDDDDHDTSQNSASAPKRPRLEIPVVASSAAGAVASYQARTAALQNLVRGNPINPGNTLSGMGMQQYQQQYAAAAFAASQSPLFANSNNNGMANSGALTNAISYGASLEFDKPQFVELPSDFVPTWNTLVPNSLVKPPKRRNKKAYELSLINLSEFTITGLPLYYQGPPTPISGLRAVIKRISREHGTATFERERDGSGGGRWKIPLAAYQPLVSYIRSDPDVIELKVIPPQMLKVATLGQARQAKGFPTAELLLIRGVPWALAKTLAPFQRGGVEFVLDRGGRALVADEMGLGKTIQSIASMAVYHQEWPLLVLTPSGARYHWESEFRNWLGVNGAASKKLDEFSKFDEETAPLSEEAASAAGHSFPLLRDSQIHVLTSSKGEVIPNRDTRIVICSYGLAPLLAENNGITPGMFKCAIADESHMLKNSRSKRTQFLLPVLKNCSRCILLSGTPALSKPAELWPQLEILNKDKHGFWESEGEFMDKYVKNGNSARRAELHAMLTGTLMVRRLKDDILKDMPRKAREKAIISVMTPEMKTKMQECMVLLREGKGVMGKLARQHSAIVPHDDQEGVAETPPHAHAPANAPAKPTTESDRQSFQLLLSHQRMPKAGTDAEAQLEHEMLNQFHGQMQTLRYTIQQNGHNLGMPEAQSFMEQQRDRIFGELATLYFERLQGIRGASDRVANGSNGEKAEEETPTRATVLNQMYRLTGECKIPAVVRFVNKWLGDRTKGKICIFAHHIFMLDAIAKECGLSNSGAKDAVKFIRIDGKTNPKFRQEQIDAFQNDPSVRVALLGITAAGVAVTLTASSQVIFTELFWTPAIMIQAEDRCHRIGQRARVHCKYLVAKGTLDDILWRLVEKKFAELGEFVEGKEKLKMTVHRVFKDEADLHSIFDHEEDDDDDDDLLEPEQVESSEPDVLPLDSSLEHDIEEFGREEQAMLLSANGDDDDEPDTVPGAQSLLPAAPVAGPGASQEDAIALSDSDEEDEPQSARAVDLENNPSYFNVAGTLPSCRIYRMLLNGSTLGVEIAIYQRRIVVSRKLKSRVRRLGEDCKPDVGDVLVAVDTAVMPYVSNLDTTLKYIKGVLDRPKPSLLYFAEDAQFKQHYISVHPPQRKKSKPQPAPVDQVVELLDDD
ncbi:regulator of chromatin subfamily A-like protein 1 [Seminavis robusta]|uniref:Regulator of chromatin subfamily A-like protein 1 n=1 Tax=Seminavis robusta TaxID=568900 RepID=A0A9N8DXC2_9STRA|nr:regulator of chromatin subfamily A-like protein 1 [Seminavis robusta]|eukprot:Sro352_g124160.1 regulator of chromatin subfamily A-like protein 1 (1487) ;mRNA; f:19804-24761